MFAEFARKSEIQFLRILFNARPFSRANQSRRIKQNARTNLWAFKSISTRVYWKIGKGQLWQRGYHDHIIRNETDFFECLKYIKENPLKKNLDDWEFVGRVDYLK